MARERNFHESLARHDHVQGSSDRSFGLVFAIFFTVIALLPLIGGGQPRLWALGIGAGFLIAALTIPRILAPLNRLWYKFGQFLHGIVNPIIMGLIFFTTVTPIGLLMRLFGKDPLHRRPDPARVSYWILRDPPGPDPATLTKQF
ncbi:hypothetical protein JCM17960_13740 [Magnetospira thiophila]